MTTPNAAYNALYDAFVSAGCDSPKDYVIDVFYLMLPSHIRLLGETKGWQYQEVATYINKITKGVVDGRVNQF